MHTSEEFCQHPVCPWQVKFWNLEVLGEKKRWSLGDASRERTNVSAGWRLEGVEPGITTEARRVPNSPVYGWDLSRDVLSSATNIYLHK